jgi:hypothetical protein
MYIALTILKAIILLGGMGLTVANFIPGVTKRDKPKLKKAGKFFLITWGAVIVITVIEFTAFL